jgi:hypothetical protein
MICGWGSPASIVGHVVLALLHSSRVTLVAQLSTQSLLSVMTRCLQHCTMACCLFAYTFIERTVSVCGKAQGKGGVCPWMMWRSASLAGRPPLTGCSALMRDMWWLQLFLQELTSVIMPHALASSDVTYICSKEDVCHGARLANL